VQDLLRKKWIPAFAGMTQTNPVNDESDFEIGFYQMLFIAPFSCLTLSSA